jgi:hypothetical protein
MGSLWERCAALGVALVVGALTACAADVAERPIGRPSGPVETPTPAAEAATPDLGTPAPDAATPGARTGAADEGAGMIEPGLERIVDLATSDLSARTGAPATEITVLYAEAVTWSDASLGCPHPDMRYAQVPQDGARVVLESGGRRYRYHMGGHTTEPFLCEQPTAKPGPARTLEPRLPDPPQE